MLYKEKLTMVEFDIYNLDGVNEPDPITDLHAWRRYFKKRADVCRRFGEGLRTLEQEMDLIMKRFEDSDIVNFSQAKMEREYGILRDVDRKLADNMLQDANMYTDMAAAFRDYKDEENDNILLASREEHFREAKVKHWEQAEKTYLMRDKYHKNAFEEEKAEIKKALTDKEAEIEKYTKQAEALNLKIERKLEKYRQEFKKLGTIGKKLRDASNKYTEAKIRTDSKRAEFILKNLKKHAERAKVWKYDIGDSDFDRVNIVEVIEGRLPQKHMVIKKLEKYRGTRNKKELLEELKEELREDRKREKKEEENSNSNAVKKDIPISGQCYLNGKKYLVTKPFEKEQANQISLTQGKYVKQIMPVNDEGFAFGEKIGRFGRKKKGYYPVAHVIPAD